MNDTHSQCCQFKPSTHWGDAREHEDDTFFPLNMGVNVVDRDADAQTNQIDSMKILP